MEKIATGRCKLKYFLDTEFIEDGKTIELISIGIVAEDGREYYALNYDCDHAKASAWVKENVLSLLPPKPRFPNLGDSSLNALGWRNLSAIKYQVAEFMGCESFKKPPLGPQYIPRSFNDSFGWKLKEGQETPKVWADYASYDWVLFCQLFGTMMDLPHGFPRYCNDIQQYKRMLGSPDLPMKTEELHSAIAGARWVKVCYEALQSRRD